MSLEDLSAQHPATAQKTFRVLVVTNMFPHAEDPARGAFVKAQVEGLTELGCPVEVFHIRGELSTANYWYAIRKVKITQASFQPDLIYAFYGLSGWVALWQPAPVVLSLAGDDVLGTPNGRGGITLKSRIGVLLTNWAAARAALVCVQSEEMRDRLWSKRIRARTHIVPYGVDDQRFRPGDQREARRRLGLSQDAKIILFPSTPTERRKRLDLAQQAMAIVRKQWPNAVLQIVAGVKHSDMPDYYRAADCCLLTSDWEGSPNVVKEALISGIPVVSTAVGDVPQWLALSPESVLCERTPESVAAGIGQVLDQARRVDPRPFSERFASSTIAKRMLVLFSTVTAGDAQPV